ncbi:STAS domain-containing protein [Bermanella marisrubri]|uniref:STAS domain-containing protein n=1 Tax=Bermanella marisrubri TaxID=207949 RepID=Q1N2W9_9GAMM|nr:STAS domain-containing protein [Bermanella marisrubri]EAT12550.1 hypothetical protein RED65_06633 [Oceanobacter sp. RED65] [Bermanella marisrubri]QIZ84892.1 STAS domain-containing protein [Bermanella marisrubri]
METQTLDLGEKCTIVIAEDLHQTLETMVESGQPVQIDGSKLEQVDTAAMQLLFGFHQALATDGREPEWLNPSENLRNTAKILGLDSHLGLTKE